MWKPDSNWEKVMQQIRIYFKDNGYDVRMFDRLFADLKIKKQKDTENMWVLRDLSDH